MAASQKYSGESLFEKISGQFVDGTKTENIPERERRVKSISEHLWRMFNTRQGSVPHLDDYGLPDITEVYRNLPDSLLQLEKSILKLTHKYEPRLEKVTVRPIPVDALEFKLSFELSATIKGGERIRFKTSFESSGKTDVSPQSIRV